MKTVSAIFTDTIEIKGSKFIAFLMPYEKLFVHSIQCDYSNISMVEYEMIQKAIRCTGTVPLDNTIYAYLNGRISVKIELIPYIAEVLNIPEHCL